MKGYMVSLLVLLAFAAGFASQGSAEEEKARVAPRVEILDDAVMEKLAKLQEPTGQHRLLSSLAGTWDYTLQYWAKEGADPQTSSGTMTNEMILGDRFLYSKTALILNVGGQNIPYEGWGILGYDTVRNVFTSVWADTMRTGLMIGTGKYDEQSKTIEEKGHFTHPMMEKEQAYRSALQFTSDETYKQTVFTLGQSGKDFKVLEIEFGKRQ